MTYLPSLTQYKIQIIDWHYHDDISTETYQFKREIAFEVNESPFVDSKSKIISFHNAIKISSFLRDLNNILY